MPNVPDVIDADMLARYEGVLGVEPAPVPDAGMIALPRALVPRQKLTVDAHRSECRLWSVRSWAFPDLWRATGRHRLAPLF